MDATRLMLKTVLDACQTRHAVLANNLANANTPGFRRCDVPFRAALNDAIRGGDRKALEQFSPEILEDRTAAVRNDGNSVSIQTELGSMMDNNILHGAAAQILSSKYERLKKAIKGQ